MLCRCDRWWRPICPRSDAVEVVEQHVVDLDVVVLLPALPRGNGGYSHQQVFVRLFIDADLRARALSRGTRCGVVGGGLLPTLGPPIAR